MHRVVAIGSLLVGLSVYALPAPLMAQTEESWTDRPDSRAPAGVSLDHLRAPGELLITYRLLHLENAGTRVGQDTIPAVLVLQDFRSVPLSMTRQTHVLEASYGVLPWLTVQGTVPFVRGSVEIVSEDLFTRSEISGLGDLEVHGLVSLHDSWPYRAHASFGVSVPTGSIRQTGVTPMSHPGAEVLPYPMQLGSGTPDLLPALTFVTENQFGTVGGQARGVIRLGENDREYRLGHRAELTGWLAYRFTDHVSGSARLSWERWGDLSGFDPELDPWAIQMAHPVLQSGSRLDVPLGVNLRMPDGPLRGSRLSAEFLVPVHHNLDGPQLGRDWGFGLEAQVRFPRGADRQAARPPAPPPAPREAPPPAPADPSGAERGSLCLGTGWEEEILVTARGDTLVGSERTDIRAVAATAVYAETRSWFSEDEPLRFEEAEYVKFGGEVRLDCSQIVRVGEYDGIPFFAEPGAPEPFERLYAPRRPGVWQTYELRPAVRG